MKNYSDKVFEQIQNQVNNWCNAFSETDYFKKMPEDISDEAWFVTSVFSEQMYNYHLQKPTEWTGGALQGVITDLFPRKISADENMFNAVEPILESFFRYLGNMKHIKNSDALINELKKSTPMMLEKSRNSAAWGPAKQFAMAAMRNDVDFQDEKAMNKFMNAYNAGITATPPISTAKTGRNVSCPCGSGNKFKKCCGR